MTGFNFETALQLLVNNYPEENKKPWLFHSVRVGTYLYNHGYSEDTQIAGLLHDVLEDTDIPENKIKELFGNEILEIIKANSKNPSLEKSLIRKDTVQRCIECGKKALIVKVADVYDNFLYYKRENMISEIERCKDFAKLISELKPHNWNDKIFNLAEIIIDY